MEASPSTPRRSARIQKMPPAATEQITPSSTPLTTTQRSATKRSPLSPYLPTSLESFLLAIYPITLVAGSLFALLDPVARASPYNDLTQSHYANTAPSYFAKKTNVFNVYFVKRGWAWVTLAYYFFLFTHPSTGPPWTIKATVRRLQGITRYAIVTVWWIFVTQWFFGPAIIDRSFILTGGQCELVQAAEEGKVDMEPGRQFVTGLACKSVGGKWKGGHDISGHVFLLVLGSMFLFQEVLHVTLKTVSRPESRVITSSDGAVTSAEIEAPVLTGPDGATQTEGQWTLGAKSALGVALLSVYMLLMTAAYFHTWFEKLTGLIVAFFGIFLVYSLPRGIALLRQYIGLPGI